VSREAQRLERANGRLVGTQVVTQELAGPPVGGFLFSAAAWIPFAVDAVTFAAGSALVATIRGRFGPAQGALDPAGRRTTLRVEITEGLRWLAAHRVLRTTAAMVAVVNLLAAAGGAVMVLFAQEKLGLDAVGFGLLLGGSAVGGVLGSLVAARVVRVVGPARIAIWTAINTRGPRRGRARAGSWTGMSSGADGATSARGRRRRSGQGCWPGPGGWR
jgi:Na+/melibiose symporter-like transporter